MVERYYIAAVYEKDGKTPKASAQEVIGRSGKIDLLQVNAPMWFEYDTEDLKGLAMRTSYVEKFEETEDNIMVYTQNSIYKLVII